MLEKYLVTKIAPLLTDENMFLAAKTVFAFVVHRALPDQERREKVLTLAQKFLVEAQDLLNAAQVGN